MAGMQVPGAAALRSTTQGCDAAERATAAASEAAATAISAGGARERDLAKHRELRGGKDCELSKTACCETTRLLKQQPKNVVD